MTRDDAPAHREIADVLVIGAGASGAVVSRRLAEAGFGVVCLEQGDWPDRGAFRGTEPDWELAIRKQWSSSPNLRRNPGDSDLDLSDSDMVVGNFNGVGGGTVIFAGVWPRLLPGDFATRSTAGVADDWPLTYDELAPFFEETDRQFGVSGLGGNPAYPPGTDPPLPPLPIGRAGLHLARAHARLGWHWWPESNAILSAAYDGRHACVQRGTCGAGCSEGAKASTDLTHWPRAIAAGTRLVTGARVARITTDATGRATGAEWIDRDGATQFTAADVVLCAASGVGTARLLLLSASAGAPDGLANSSGLVGRRLMLHPGAMVTGYLDEDLESWQGQAGGLIQSLEFYGTDERRGFAGGSKWSLMPTGGPVRVALSAAGRAVLGDAHHAHVQARLRAGRAVGAALRGPAGHGQPRRAVDHRGRRVGPPDREDRVHDRRLDARVHRLQRRPRHGVAPRGRRVDRRHRADGGQQPPPRHRAAWATTPRPPSSTGGA